ncbi:glutamate receptor 1-like [Saccoglossus kowalevskii]
MIGQVANEEVDLAAAPITITSIRENVVDFSKPFMHTSIRALMKKPSVDSKTTSLFGIFTPFTFWVWICIVISFLVVGLVMFFLSRMSPYGWRALYTRGEVSWDEGQYFNCLNSFWFVMSTFTLQGYHNAPRSVATRFLSGIWFFFTLVILFAYLSNLGAFLTVERMDHPIQNVDDLSRQTTIRYGTNEFGATAVFFRNSNVPIYQRMWEFMSEAVPSVFTYGSEEGIQRVIKSNGRYVYFGESALLQYAASRDCSLSLMPGALNLRSYGFAFPTGSTLRDEFSGAILELQENGNLQLLYTKWFFGPCSSEQEDLEDDDRVRVAALPLVNLSGAFIILLIGVAISIPLALCEWVFYNRSDGKRRKSDAPKSDSGAQTVSGV